MTERDEEGKLTIMFDRIKQLNELRKAKDELAKEVIEVEHRGITVRLAADFSLREIKVDGEVNDRIKEAINRALKEVQKIAAKEMKGKMGSLGINF